jgi:hypothetical protein
MFETNTLRYYQRKINALLKAAYTDHLGNPEKADSLRSTADPETFAAVVKMLDQARLDLPAACQRLREEGGYSWAEIAAPLGVTRDAAYKRFGRKTS